MKVVKGLALSSGAKQKLIVDCGLNKGLVASRMLDELDGFSLFGFEVQQDIGDCTNTLKRKFPDRKIEVNYIAVSNRNGTVNYYEPRHWGKNYKGGTTITRDKISDEDDYRDRLEAPSIDFSKWLYKQIPEDSFVFVKMDIEGAEYEVINHLMQSGAIDLIDVMAIEWHAHKFKEPARSNCQAIERSLKEYAQNHSVEVLDWF